MIASGSPRKTIDPRWIAPIYSEEEGQDYLGLRMVQENIVAHLLPGVTTITPRARYYPFYCWLMTEYVAQHPPGWSFNRFLRRREQIFGLANVAHDSSVIGLTGVTAFSEHWEQFGSQEQVPLSLDESYIAASRGGYAAYAGVVRNLGLVRDHEEGEGWEVLIQGQKLAAAFAEAIAPTTYYRERHRYDEANSIPAAVLTEYGRYCHLDLLAKYPDQGPTLESLFSFSAPVSPDPRAPDASPLGNMRGSLAIILEMVNQSTQPFNEDVFRANSAYGACRDYREYHPSENLLPVLSQWQIFQLRELYVYALYALWTYFLHWLQGEGPAPLEPFYQHLKVSLDLTSVAREFALPLQYPEPAQMTLDNHLIDLLEACGLQADDWGERFQRFGELCTAQLNTQRVYEHLKSLTPANPDYVGSAWLLLASLYMRLSALSEEEAGWHWAEFGGTHRRSLSEFLKGMSARLHSAATLLETLRWLFRDYVIAQHTLISLEKWRQRRANTFHFRYENGLFEWVRQGRADLSASRFRQAYDMLADLGMFDTAKEDGQAVLSDLGHATLERVLDSFHV